MKIVEILWLLFLYFPIVLIIDVICYFCIVIYRHLKKEQIKYKNLKKETLIKFVICMFFLIFSVSTIFECGYDDTSCIVNPLYSFIITIYLSVVLSIYFIYCFINRKKLNKKFNPLVILVITLILLWGSQTYLFNRDSINNKILTKIATSEVKTEYINSSNKVKNLEGYVELNQNVAQHVYENIDEYKNKKVYIECIVDFSKNKSGEIEGLTLNDILADETNIENDYYYFDYFFKVTYKDKNFNSSNLGRHKALILGTIVNTIEDELDQDPLYYVNIKLDNIYIYE